MHTISGQRQALSNPRGMSSITSIWIGWEMGVAGYKVQLLWTPQRGLGKSTVTDILARKQRRFLPVSKKAVLLSQECQRQNARISLVCQCLSVVISVLIGIHGCRGSPACKMQLRRIRVALYYRILRPTKTPTNCILLRAALPKPLSYLQVSAARGRAS